MSYTVDSSMANVVAIFHASFHPTKGNVVDWCLKVDEDLDLDGVEFSVLPSGLHLVERDIVYFSHAHSSGVAVFRRRPTNSHGHRGFRLSSMGILLRDSPRPRPWQHIQSLRLLADDIYAKADAREDEAEAAEGLTETGTGGQGNGAICSSDLTDKDFEPARVWFEKHRISFQTQAELWKGWSAELDGELASRQTPSYHLPHLLRIMGLSSLTLYKFVLSRRRVMILTLPPVEVAGILAWVASDLCREHHAAPKNQSLGVPIEDLFSPSTTAEEKPRKGTPKVFGMVTLSDIDRLESESAKGDGWIACTTDAIFMEKPQYYDLIIDLTTSTPSKASRPVLHMSKHVAHVSNGRQKASWKLETVRFTWSDVKVWTELDRLLKLDAEHSHNLHLPHAHPHPGCEAGTSGASRWGDAFKLYEDVCVLCASLWMGAATWRSNSHVSFSSPGISGNSGGGWGSVRLEGDDDWSVNGTHMRNLGQGIEGRKAAEEERLACIRNVGLGIEGRPSASATKHSSVVSSQPKHSRSASTSKSISQVAEVLELEDDSNVAELHRQTIQTTLALLQTFHANTVFLLSRLHELMPPPSSTTSPVVTTKYTRVAQSDDDIETIVLTSRDMLSLDLGVLSDLDSRFIEWLAEAEGYTGARTMRRVVVRRGWQDLLGIMFGFR